jgi:ATP-dependent DNA ligase
VWVGTWSASTVLAAVLLVGGLSYWTRFYRPERIADRNLIAAATALAQGKASNKEFMESLEDFANKQDLTKKKDDKADNKPDKRSTLHCVILGYNLGPEKELAELILGTLRDDEIRYAGRVKRGFNPENGEELLDKLKPLVVSTSAVPGILVTATWVKPQLFCEVHQSGYDDEGHLKDPRYHGLLKVE